MAKNTVEVGKREERSIVKDLEGKGYSARRQPGSGNRAVDLQHDILWRDSPIGKLHIEAKYRDKSQWRTLEGWQAGADILTVRAARGERMAFLSWDLLLQLIGSAADRSEHMHELPEVAPDKPWLNETDIALEIAAANSREMSRLKEETHQLTQTLDALRRKRACIQAAHQNPPQRKPKPNKLKGRGFGK